MVHTLAANTRMIKRPTKSKDEEILIWYQVKSKQKAMIGGKNIIVFIFACAFAFYQFRKAKRRSEIHSPTHQLKISKNLMQHHLNMFEHDVVESIHDRGDKYIIIMQKIKDLSGKVASGALKAPKILGILVEDKAATRRYRNRRKHGNKRKGHKYRRSSYHSSGRRSQYGRNRGKYKRRHGVHPRNNRDQDITYEPRLKLYKYSNSLNKIEFLLAQRGLITNELNSKGNTQSSIDSSSKANEISADEPRKASATEEEIKTKSVEEINRRTADKMKEEGKKKNEQEKKGKEEARKEKKRESAGVTAADKEAPVDISVNSDGESQVLD